MYVCMYVCVLCALCDVCVCIVCVCVGVYVVCMYVCACMCMYVCMYILCGSYEDPLNCNMHVLKSIARYINWTNDMDTLCECFYTMFLNVCLG